MMTADVQTEMHKWVSWLFKYGKFKVFNVLMFLKFKFKVCLPVCLYSISLSLSLCGACLLLLLWVAHHSSLSCSSELLISHVWLKQTCDYQNIVALQLFWKLKNCKNMLAIIVIVNNHDQNCKNLFKFGAASCLSELTKLCQLAHESKRVNEAECIIM